MDEDASVTIVIGRPRRNCERIASAGNACAAKIHFSPTGSRSAIDAMPAFAARHDIAPRTEHFPMSRVNEAMDHLRAGKARYHIVLDADFR